MILLTLMAWAVGVGMTSVMGVPNRLPRQVDTSHLTDDNVVCLITGNCNAEQPQTPTAPTAPPSSGCTCVKWWQCKDNDIPDATNPGISVVVNLRNVVPCQGDINDICCQDFDLNLQRPAPPEQQTSSGFACGKRNPDGVGLKVEGFNDRQAQYGEFPWMAAVLRRGVKETAGIPIFVCGGSLIHSRFVLTSAHNVQDKQAPDLLVRLGEWDFKNPSESIPHQDINVTRIVIHENYDANNILYDVALLILEREVQLGPTIQTICSPSPSQRFDGARCFSTGWGKDVFSENGSYQQIMKSVDLPMVDHNRCQNALRSTQKLGLNFILHRSFVCAGGEPGVDMCTGDGGSPLVCPMPGDPNTFVQVGVVSWGLGCGEAGIPGVYASVSEAVPWISTVIQNNLSLRDLLRSGR